MASYKAGEDTRNALISAAKKLFYEKGYDETTIKEICEQANVKRTAFFYHFKNKNDLVVQIYDKINNDSMEIINEYLSKLSISNDIIYITLCSTAIFFSTIMSDSRINRFFAEIYLSQSLSDSKSYQRRHNIMFKKRNLPTDSNFHLYLAVNFSFDGHLLQEYYQNINNLKKEKIIRYKLSFILWNLKYKTEEIDSFIDEIMNTASKVSITIDQNLNAKK